MTVRHSYDTVGIFWLTNILTYKYERWSINFPPSHGNHTDLPRAADLMTKSEVSLLVADS